MIFAELDYECDYNDVHDELVALLRKVFPEVEDGQQGDSWIWIHEGAEKVAVDTFTSMRHQVKSARPGPLVRRVIEVLQRVYRLEIHEPPLPEGHEDS
jgi:hypothetical protein